MSTQIIDQVAEVIYRRLVYGDNSNEVSLALNMLQQMMSAHYPDITGEAVSNAMKCLRMTGR